MAGKKAISLTTQGQRVMGALATFIVPRLAADQSLQSAELENLCKSISPGRYDRQIEGIVGTVNERFASRLATDESLADLRKILAALMPANLAQDEDGEDEFPFEKKAKDAKVDDEGEEDEDNEEDEDEDFDEGEDSAVSSAAATNINLKSKKGDQNAEEEAQWVGPTKVATAKDKSAKDAALVAAMDTARNEGAELAMRRMAARYEAAEIVKPIVGKVNVFASDSAAAIYKLALDAKGVDLTGVPKVAYKSVLQTVLKTETAAQAPKVNRFAQDSAVTKTLLEEFPTLPALA